ncbi:hypothetical protein [Ottowia thiooxydans]|uniref:hypothetical protein n=1 Tax=Ottowia thiooxydans TaxID=219182 RepID=UPI000403DF82|nr:hypothetical protein [Ottowia thiooxydans]
MSVSPTATITLTSTQHARSSSFDLEAAVLAMTMDRISVFDEQLASKMEKMKEKNAKASLYNAAMQTLNKVKNTFANDAKSDTQVSAEALKLKTELEAAFKAAGLAPGISKKIDNSKAIPACEASINLAQVNIKKIKAQIDEKTKNLHSITNIADLARAGSDINSLQGKLRSEENNLSSFQANLVRLKDEHNPEGTLTKATTKADIENAINAVQGLVDENNNTSQMDQLQLQSLISKRNSMFETASTVMKKIMDSLMSIVGNMR